MPFKFNPFTGKLDYFEPAGAAANGLPAGGSAEQVLAKVDGTNYNAYWKTATSGSGDVVGPASSVNAHIAVFDGTTGKLIADSGYDSGAFDANGAAGTVQTNLNTHTGLTASVHNFDGSGNAPAQTHGNSRHSSTFVATSDSDYVYILQDVIKKLCSGLYDGGGISIHTGNTGIDIASGHGVINDHTGAGYTPVTFTAKTNITPVGNGTNYVAIHSNDTVDVSLTKQTMGEHIYLGHFFAQGGYVLECFPVAEWAGHFMGRINEWMSRASGVLVETGLGVSEQGTTLKLSIAAGTFFARLGTFTTSTITAFTKMYNSSDNGWGQDTNSPNYVNVTQWNNVSNPQASALVTMTASYWKKDLVLITPSGNVYYIFGQTEYSSEDLAKKGAIPVIPAAIDEDGCYLATIVCQKGDTSIANRLWDIRPYLPRIFGYGSGTAGIVVDHATLTNLAYASSGHTGFADSAHGVTNGDSHDHNGGDGGTIDHVNLNNKGTNTHATIDTHLSSTSNPHSTSDANIVTSDITTNDTSITKHGFFPKLPNTGGTTFWADNGTWQNPGAASMPQVPLTNRYPSADTTITANYCVFMGADHEPANGFVTDILDNAILEVA